MLRVSEKRPLRRDQIDCVSDPFLCFAEEGGLNMQNSTINSVNGKRAMGTGTVDLMPQTIQPLKAEMLCRGCDPGQFSFETTAELEDLTEIIGQARAVEAVQFGIGILQDGYNLFCLGPAGVGKHYIVRHFLDEKAATEPAPNDW